MRHSNKSVHFSFGSFRDAHFLEQLCLRVLYLLFYQWQRAGKRDKELSSRSLLKWEIEDAQRHTMPADILPGWLILPVHFLHLMLTCSLHSLLSFQIQLKYSSFGKLLPFNFFFTTPPPPLIFIEKCEAINHWRDFQQLVQKQTKK